MSQTKLSSLYEALINILIGYMVNFAANFLILPVFFNVVVDWKTNLMMGIPYTFVSIARQYAIRRWFNARIHRAAKRLAGET
ncbi:MAG: hypothetical protein KGI47_10475 [Betaproteobacteria bacterium]|nr:hypothetical protein [Betaproteobacteria bacterium]